MVTKIRLLPQKIQSAGLPIERLANALPGKIADPHYLTPEHKAWRGAVLERAGQRCEFVDQYGQRCRKAAPWHRLFADHIVELADGGEPFDPTNGQCLCGACHARKTIRARTKRLGGTED